VCTERPKDRITITGNGGTTRYPVERMSRSVHAHYNPQARNYTPVITRKGQHKVTENVIAIRGMEKDRYEMAISFADAVAEATSAGLSREDMLTVLNPYEALNQDKSPLLDVPFMIRHVAFLVDEKTQNAYLNMWVITENNKLYRVTDGSTGIHKQMLKLVGKRLDENHPAPYDYFVVPGGLRSSEFDVDADGIPIKRGDKTTKVASTATTFYLA
jgi:hypothetical protein